MVRPVRLQLSRRKGFDLQQHSRAVNGLEAAKVARPSIFGNPFSIASAVDFHAGFPDEKGTPRDTAIKWFREWLDGEWPEKKPPPSRADIIRFLGGKNLACYCHRGQACHADVLLELANPTEQPG